jgi:hypothetical protein
MQTSIYGINKEYKPIGVKVPEEVKGAVGVEGLVTLAALCLLCIYGRMYMYIDI